MSFLYAAAAVLVLLVLLHLRYQVKEASEMPGEKPRFCWQPKFQTAFELPGEIADGGDPVGAVSRKLGEYGFGQAEVTDTEATFSRGSVVGDFSIKLAKVVLVFELPLVPTVKMEARLGGFAPVFDTGDLWEFVSELKQKGLERMPADG